MAAKRPDKPRLPADKPALVPPDESDMQKYNANQELPISIGSSFMLHFLVILLFAAGLSMQMKGCTAGTQPESPGVEIVDAGGGGQGDGAGDPNSPRKPKELAIRDRKPQEMGLPLDPKEIAKLELNEKPRPVLPQRTETDKPFGDPTKPNTGNQGLGGLGRNGGLGDGDGTGVGDKTGPGIQTQRSKRNQRWRMSFPYGSGSAYLAKLENLGATIVVPQGDGKYVIFRDLSRRPPVGSVEGEAAADELRRKYIRWIDDKQASVSALAAALKLSFMPDEIVVHFPVELEKALLGSELAYRGLTEEQLNERNILTLFRAERVGSRYEVSVVEQRPKREGD
jgi:hypothetical protein